MAVIDLVNIVDQRLKEITSQNPSLTVDGLYLRGETGLWGLITIKGSEGKTIELDFIESDLSYKRDGATEEYALAALDQVNVVVIVPDQVVAEVLLLVKGYDVQGVIVSDYSAMGLIPLPLTY
jgi:hypothetical protein